MYKITSEIEQMFNEDIREKKKAASGAYHRASRGVAPVRVRNQSDNLTAKELREMSGEVVSFMQKPIKWRDLKDMPVEAQRHYVEWLKSEYNATATMISEMLDCHYITFLKHNKEVLWVTFPNSARADKTTKKRWQEFCDGKKEDPVEIIEEPKEPEQGKPCGKMTRCTLSAENVAELIELLKQIEPVMADGSIVATLDVRNGVE